MISGVTSSDIRGKVARVSIALSLLVPLVCIGGGGSNPAREPVPMPVVAETSKSTTARMTGARGGSWQPQAHLVYGPKDGIYMSTYGGNLNSPQFEQQVDAALALPYIRGIAHYQQWNTFEPQQGTYDFRQLDVVVQRAKKAGKFCIIGMQAGVMSPAWVMDKTSTVDFVHANPGWTKWSTIQIPVTVNGQTFVMSRMPNPFDSTYQALLNNMLSKIAARYDGDPSITFINVTGPSASGGVEANLAINVPASRQANPNFDSSLGFTLDKYIAAWKSAIDATLHIFKNSTIGMATNAWLVDSSIASPRLTTDQEMSAERRIRDYLVTQHLALRGTPPVIRNCGLSSVDNTWGDPNRIDDKPKSTFTALEWEVRDKALIGYEFAAANSMSNGPAELFGRAVHNGITGYGRYIEVKVPDVLTLALTPRAAYQPVLAEAARIMCP